MRNTLFALTIAAAGGFAFAACAPGSAVSAGNGATPQDAAQAQYQQVEYNPRARWRCWWRNGERWCGWW
jgi:hypothetical protein